MSIPSGAGVARLALTGMAQATIQLTGFISGLVIIRYLPVTEYAYYTIANAVLGTLIVLADSGISQSVLARGGRVWSQPGPLGGVLASGLYLRRRFGLLAAGVALPLLWFLLHRQGASSSMSLLVTLSILPLFLSSLSGQLFEIVPRLAQRLQPLQAIQLAGAGLRFVLVALAAGLWPAAWLASLAAGCAQMWSSWRLRRLVAGMVVTGPPDPDATRDITAQVRRTLPGAFYFAFAGQINVWLISLLGTTNAVAQVGALGRLAMAFNVLSAIVSLVVVPRFARMEATGRGAMATRFWQVQGGLLVLLALAVSATALSPGPILALLGEAYASLTHELVLAALGGALALLSGSTYSLAAARGVVAPAWFVVPFAVALQATLIVLLPIASVAGVLWLGVLTNFAYWLLHAGYFVARSLRRFGVDPSRSGHS